MAACPLVDSGRAQWCRNAQAATHLKLVSVGVILATSVAGIASPVVLARLFQGSPSYGRALLLIKCFAAGVILSTSLVHVMPDAFAALADCQVASRHPWRDFPFSGLVTLIGVILALLVDIAATSHASAASSGGGGGPKQHQHYERIKPEDGPVIAQKQVQKYEPLKVEEGKMKPPAVAAAMELGACHGHQGGGVEEEVDEEEEGGKKGREEERLAKLKQKMVSQVLEIGIVFHSVIIGVTMGMSQNQCSIRPLVIALSFHQIFEGMGLGGCIAQAGFGLWTVAYMCIMFAVTTPLGIVLGMLIFYLTGYDDSSPNALVAEGLLGSISAGVLIYMALVDLIAVDFFHNKIMTSSSQLKKASYVALALGSASMSILAIWA